MLKLNLKSQIQWKTPLTMLSRCSNIITGVNSRQELIEIDTRNCYSDCVLSYRSHDIVQPSICQIKYLKCQLGNQYYFIFDKQIKSSSGILVSSSNSKSDFVKGLDAHDDLFIFMKYHTNYSKYSLNTMKIGQQKKIVKLFDHQINKINIIGKRGELCVILEKSDGNLEFVFGEYWDCDQGMKNKKYYCDNNYVYLMSSRQKNQNNFDFQTSRLTNLTNKILQSPKSQREVKEYQPPKSPSNRKFRIEAYQQSNLTKGRGYSQFEFNLEQPPLKMDNFQNDLLVAFSNCLEVYDIRKIIKPYEKQMLNDIHDFYYEPNLQKLYLSCQKSLMIYDFK